MRIPAQNIVSNPWDALISGNTQMLTNLSPKTSCAQVTQQAPKTPPAAQSYAAA